MKGKLRNKALRIRSGNSESMGNGPTTASSQRPSRPITLRPAPIDVQIRSNRRVTPSAKHQPASPSALRCSSPSCTNNTNRPIFLHRDRARRRSMPPLRHFVPPLVTRGESIAALRTWFERERPDAIITNEFSSAQSCARILLVKCAKNVAKRQLVVAKVGRQLVVTSFST